MLVVFNVNVWWDGSTCRPYALLFLCLTSPGYIPICLLRNLFGYKKYGRKKEVLKRQA